MWIASVAQVLMLLAPGAEPGTAWVESTPPLPKSIATRQTLFSIPFQISRNEQPGREAVEVQLYASSNRGARWDLYNRTEPSKGQFLFRAAGDGEYWFLIRTVDKSGGVHPQYNNNPGLIVLVDTNPPVLNLEAKQGDGGQITTRWQATDPHLNASSLQIQYRTTPGQDWQNVAIDRKTVNVAGPTQSGEVSWWSKVGSGRVEIRGEVTDTAGNVTVTHAQVNLESGPVAFPGPQGSSPPMAQAASRATGTVSLRANPPIRNQFVAQTQSAIGPSLGPQIPGMARPRMVNTRLFELEYNVQGAPSVGRVELWGTSDGGRTWSRFGTDDDGRSPMLVAVPQEGIYGFRIAAEVRPGRGSQPPQAGESPDVMIGVDLSKPFAEIVSVEQGDGDTAQQVIVRWKAEDRILTPRPIVLALSEMPGGPWTTIAENLENTGEHAWTIGDHVPPRFFLRLEARDEAGNVGVYETPKAIEIRLPQPTLQIRDIRPLNGSARTPPKRYHFLK